MFTSAPVLYEVNTRVWLRELSEKAGRKVTLADIPDSEIQRWVELGFTHIWLMGVWQVGPKARAMALKIWNDHWRKDIPSTEGDVQGSPFAVQEYAVDSRLGDALSLLMLKERFSRAGLRLIIDFVPNHLGVDSTEPIRFPARFVHSVEPAEGTFPAEARFGDRYFAHGRDPYFQPWADTVQLDYRVVETHQAMAATAQTVSMFGDGLRCDMAMLLLPEIFLATWKNFPPQAANRTDANFWKHAIGAVRQLQPQVELIAEVYWDREEELQAVGFDYTYNKRVCDYIHRGEDEGLVQFLAEKSDLFLRRSVHFLENHDEKRAAFSLSLERHKAAAALILFLPGMALLHDGQLEGRKHFAPIQLTKRVEEDVDETIRSFYEHLLKTLQKTHVRRGKGTLLRLEGATSVVAVRWEGRNGEVDYGIVNLGAKPVDARLPGADANAIVLYQTKADSGKPRGGDGILTMPAESACILRIHPAI